MNLASTSSELFGSSSSKMQPAKLRQANSVARSNGLRHTWYAINLVGEAEKIYASVKATDHYVVKPTDFHTLTPKLTVKIGDKSCKLETEIVEANVPLLLSKSSLKKAGTLIDMKSDKARMFDKEVDLHQSSNGHYCIDVFPKTIIKIMILKKLNIWKLS